MEHPLNESAWRRGGHDTLRGWKSAGFIILEAVLAPLLGFIVDWWWSIVAVAGGMFCIWIGATAWAPIKQRNEARDALNIRRKPLPLDNRQELVEAIVETRQAAFDFLNLKAEENIARQQSPNVLDTNLSSKVDKSLKNYQAVANALEVQCKVAGGEYKIIG